MAENPFDQTTMGTSGRSTPTTTPLSEDSFVELRLSQASRMMPFVALPGTLIAPIIVYFMIPAPLNIIMAILVVIFDIAVFGFLWFFVKASFVRADDDGITVSLMGGKRTIDWKDVSNFDLAEEAKSSRTKYHLKDKHGATILEFDDFGNKIDGIKMREFIAAKLAGNQ